MISTKTTPESAIKDSGSGISPILEPGNHKIKINSIELFPSNNPQFGDKLNLQVETEPLPNFQGIEIQKGKPELGRYAGRVGFVNYDRWGYKDHLTTQGVQIYKEVELQVAIHEICKELGLVEWYEAQDGKHDNMSAFIKAFNAEKPFKGIYFYACIGGRAYMNKANYLAYDMNFVAKNRSLGLGYSMKENKVQRFEYAVHVSPIKEASTTVQAVASPSTTGSAPAISPTVSVSQTTLRDPTTPIIAPGLSELEFFKEGKQPTMTEQIEMDAAAQKAALGEFANSGLPKQEEPKGIVTNPDMEKMPWDE